MKVLGIDYGERRIGIAVSDDKGRLAVPRGVLEQSENKNVVEDIARMIAEDEIETVVVGLPLTFHGGESGSADRARAFAKRLQDACAAHVVFEDERLTTSAARRDARTRGNAPSTDADAAANILQTYLDRNRSWES